MVQYGLLETKEENELKAKKHDESQLSFLPVNPLQEKHLEQDPELSSRELEIMHMTLTGVRIQQIAMKIFLSIAGVKWRLCCVYRKFGVNNRLDLLNKAAKTGLQFKTESGIKQTFHLKLYFRDHNIHERKDQE